MTKILRIVPRIAAVFVGFVAVWFLLDVAGCHHRAVAQSGVRAFCLYKGGWVTGNTRQCVYSCNGNQIIITIPAYKICPITIQN